MNISILVAALVFLGGTSFADDLDDSFNKIGDTLCKVNIREKEKVKEYKALKLSGSKIEGMCLLSMKSAISNCAAETLKIYKSALSSKDKTRASKMMKSSLQFCSNYADVQADNVVNLIIDTAIKNKISIDEAVNKEIDAAGATTK